MGRVEMNMILGPPKAAQGARAMYCTHIHSSNGSSLSACKFVLTQTHIGPNGIMFCQTRI